MDAQQIGNTLHRTAKMLIDAGAAATLDDAMQQLGAYRVLLIIGPDVAQSPTLQTMVLTAVNTGRRCFLGGILVTGNVDVPLRAPWRECRTLRDAVVDLQGTVVPDVVPDIPQILIGDAADVGHATPFAVRATFDGWTGGIIPAVENERLPERQEFAPSGVLAGALAVSEAFQHLSGNVMAGRRSVGLSLWRPDDLAWRTADPGPMVERLPSRLWLIGLGHLGQAFLWTLGLLSYAAPAEVNLVLQDFDTLVAANDSTSPLTTVASINLKKTRAMAAWCEARGFRTTIQERRFGGDFTVNADEPRVALCGVDNPQARAALEDVGFERVIEAGLGGGPREYLAFQIHSIPSDRTARQQWGSGIDAAAPPLTIDQPAYRALAAKGLDACGLTTLAGRSVGASFVGTVVSTIAIAELLRIVQGAHQYDVIDGTLRSLDHCQAIMRDTPLPPFNPGWTGAAQ